MGERKNHDPAQRAYEAYYSMPKDFVSPEDADTLWTIYNEISPRKNSYGYLYTAGSAALESGLRAYHRSPAERHERIAKAKRSWQLAQDAFIFSHLDRDWSDSKLFLNPDRIQANLLYIDLCHEMIDGFVEEATVGKLHASLVGLATRNKELHDEAVSTDDWGAAVGRRGLGYEVGTLLTVTRLGCPSFFAMLATARADHGGFMGETTHDVRVIQQSHGKINWFVPFEVKPTDFHSEEYKGAFTRGRVELLMPSSVQDLDLVDYMRDELEGTISKQHLEELDELTSRTLALTRDYQARLEYEQMFPASA